MNGLCKFGICVALVFAMPAAKASAQMLKPEKLLSPPTDSWPTYNGDYSGRRFSQLNQINNSNIQSMGIAWLYRLKNAESQRGAVSPEIKSTPLMVDGILYFTIPNHVYAVDARTGKELWTFDWEDHGGILVGNRGLGMYHGWLYFLTPDDWFISLDARTGKERWRKKVADEKLQYFTTIATLVVGNHVILGVGGDTMDVPGFLEARDPETGDVQWTWNTEPAAGQPGSETWPNVAAMSHGGGMTWLPGTYDPQLKLLYWGTGNPNPVFAGQGRKGDNLWTCSIVALNADTGKLVWYFQASPHDTHDWDNVETPVLFDADIDGKPRKLLAQASRNGYFFVLDRINGNNIVSTPFVQLNWSKGVDAQGQPVPDPNKEPQIDGALVSMSVRGATNWQPPSYDPQTKLFYVNGTKGYSVAYLTDTDPKPEGYGGSGHSLWTQNVLEALDYKTGRIAWEHCYSTFSSSGGGGRSPGILTTAGNLLFTGDYSGNFIAYNPLNGEALWHSPLLHSLTNGPETFLLDGKQFVVAGAGDMLFAFRLLP